MASIIFSLFATGFMDYFGIICKELSNVILVLMVFVNVLSNTNFLINLCEKCGCCETYK